jgi:hypothetical protein
MLRQLLMAVLPATQNWNEQMSTAEAFENNNYVVQRDLLDPDLVKFLSSYYQSAREGQAGEFSVDWTSINGKGDACADVVLYSIKSKIEELTGLKLWPTYSFVRIYKKGDVVGRHKDGPANQVSCTMCISRDDVDWPLGFSDGETEGSVVMKPGDGVIYRGFKLDHWRDKFIGNNQVQLIVGFVIRDAEFDAHRFYGRGKPMYIPSAIKRAGPVKLTKAFLFRVRERFRKIVGTSA